MEPMTPRERALTGLKRVQADRVTLGGELCSRKPGKQDPGL